MRVRVRYAKTGKVRFVSAIDLGRIWERALRKARLPVAYSEGFSPHPQVRFPDALPLGYGSIAEYAELEFADSFPIEPALKELNAAFPEGIEVRAGVEVVEGAPRLSKWLRASAWDLAYPGDGAAALEEAVARILDAERVLVPRDKKGEVTEVDLRPALNNLVARSLALSETVLPPDPDIGDAHGVVEAGGATLAEPTEDLSAASQEDATSARVRALVHHVEPPMRPSEVHAALAAHCPHPWRDALEPGRVTRVAQGEFVDEGLREAIGGTIVPPRPEAVHRE
ncbi:TIGR03936 family radical SAM-associated protein [Egibacter rhizosphaerae]|uniref:TIGR03936 family radical SAM-associated protein n=1 Tax=Egibacter rhizosphaerae TaxID=1670831 RepID=UPI0013F1594C|nr:TIGR03936 family radical SAM-associated protein [Egibacter rhizosphaerae]